jgi:hypothetical protein
VFYFDEAWKSVSSVLNVLSVIYFKYCGTVKNIFAVSYWTYSNCKKKCDPMNQKWMFQ